MDTPNNALKNAVDTIAGRGDQQGYNKFDAPLGHSLAQLRIENWTSRQTHAVWHMLAKYARQLSEGGIEYSAIPEPPVVPSDRPARFVSLKAEKFIVKFAYDHALVEAVKALPGRRFDAELKQWSVPTQVDAVEALFAFIQKNDFECDSRVLDRMAELVEARAKSVAASRAEDAEIEIAGLGGELRPFQKAGVVYALRAKRTFIADEMGLGKTVEALATIQAANAYPAIVVCPASLKLNWRKEAEKWLPGHSVAAWNGKAEKNVPAEIVIVNYDILNKNLEALKALQPQAVVYDESHYCFPAGTMVSTHRGNLPIEDIVHNRLRVSVLSCSSSHNALEYKDITDWLEYPIYMSLVKITHEKGEFICTADHPIWTENGYQEAVTLTSGTYLRVVLGAIPKANEGQIHGAFLFSKLRGSAQSAGNQALEVSGQEKNSGFELSRVVSVEILQRGSDDGNGRNSRVYCLSVAGNENFFANGVLVSNCKNYKAQRTEAAKELAKGVPYRLALTGTPILNRPGELLSQLGIIGRLDDLGGFWNFSKRYCNAHRGPFGWDFSGAAHLDELNEKMRTTCFIRRNKADVLPELPAKQRTILPVELSNRAEYRRAERELIAYLREQAVNDQKFHASIAYLPEPEQAERRTERANDAARKAERAEQLVRIEALKQLAAAGKLDAVGEWVESFLETGEKLVVFAHHRQMVHALAERFSAPAITGETPIEKRQEYVDRFQNDPGCRLMVLNIRAGGVGLTLTAASNVAFVELDWNPAAHAQAEDRVHRIGQQASSVNAWYLLADGTIDTEIHRLIEAKRQVVDAATDGDDGDFSNGILKELVKALVR